MHELHYFGLVRFSKRSGKIDTTMTGLGKGVIQMWALQNTPKAKACVIVNIDEHKVVSEYIGTEDGFPEWRRDPDTFEFEIPDKLYEIFEEEVTKSAATA